ncbi:histone acetyltransferase family protein (macronuclear) [Tetrahymena thermophila SB210]|uniref:Histone acetyltransferase family protein n=1 Tax=Tetrahymena thermophila (strain SB210) TaxID=312017 RepID=I7MM19_TETTS|nr:histone acetyltransferase family protein [Tetrahymena thermophila SB210]EAS03805.2 histone acetyltransferase family protein [Tetrahymena thermophila SB210]|eukprot:XP_001024050.2 histone acetyltransferase family protein [Tetrahymena thermophila SB210]
MIQQSSENMLQVKSSENVLQVKLSGKNSQTLINISKKADSFIYDEEAHQNNTNRLNIAELSFGGSIEQSNISQNNSIIGFKNDQDENLLKNKSQNYCKYIINNETATDYVEQDLRNSQKIKNVGSPIKQNHTRILQERAIDKIQKAEFSKTQQLSINNAPPAQIDEQTKIISNGLNSIDKVIRIITFIKPQVLKFFENYTMSGRYRQFNLDSRLLVNDRIDFSQYISTKKPSFVKQILNAFYSVFLLMIDTFFLLLSKLPLINPENKIRIIITSIIVCYNCFYLLLVSFTVFFEAEFEGLFEILSNIANGAWVFEMLISMNTSTYHEGEFVTDRRIIFKIYTKEYLLFEILPLIFDGKSSSNITLDILYKLPLLLKLKGMSIVLIKLEFLILQHLKKHYILLIIKLLLQILLLTHLMACSYVALAQFEMHFLNIHNTWINQSQLMVSEYKWWVAYFEAQLWAFHTMGNSYSISVSTQLEYAITSFWMLISCVLYAYLVNTLGSILQNINLNSENYKKDLNTLNKYMQRKKIDLELQRIMNIHLQNQYEQQLQVQFDQEKETLNKLSYHMRNKLFTESNKNIIKQFSFLKQFSQQTLTSVYQIMQEESYTEGLTIPTFDLNSQDSFLYLIIQGSVDIIQLFQLNQEENDFLQEYQNEEKKKSADYQKKGQKVVKRLTVGQTFGEYEFFANSQLPYKIQSCKQTIVIKISLKQFIQIVNQNKQDYQIFMEIKHKVQLNNEMSIIKTNCIICNAKNHHFLECLQAHLPKHPQFTIFKHTYYPSQERDTNYKRIKSKHDRCLIINTSEQKQLENEFEEDVTSIDQYTQDKADPNQNDNKQILYEVNRIRKKSRMQESLKNIEEQMQADQIQIGIKSQEFKNSEVWDIKNNIDGKNNSDINNNMNISCKKKQISNSKPLIKKPSSNVHNMDNKISSEQQFSQFETQDKQMLKGSNKVIEQENQTAIFSHKQEYKNSDKNVDTIISFTNKYLEPSYKNQIQNQAIIQNNNHRIVFEEAFYKDKWDSSIFYWLFDLKCEFLYFFPRSNCKHVLKSYEKIINLKKEKTKKKLEKNKTTLFKK